MQCLAISWFKAGFVLYCLTSVLFMATDVSGLTAGIYCITDRAAMIIDYNRSLR